MHLSSKIGGLTISEVHVLILLLVNSAGCVLNRKLWVTCRERFERSVHKAANTSIVLGSVHFALFRLHSIASGVWFCKVYKVDGKFHEP